MEKANLTSQIKNYQKKVNKKLNEYAQDEGKWQYLEAIITILATTFFIIFAIRPAVITIFGLVGEIREKRELSQRMQQKINVVITAQEEFATVQGKRDILESYLPSDFSISQGIAQVTGAVMESDLPLSQISLSQLEMIDPSKDLSGLSFSFSTKGDYEHMQRVIRQLDIVRRWIGIDSYKIGVNQDKGEDVPAGQLNLFYEGQLNYWFEELYGREEKK